jgi:CheY-like chemotaxis protein
MTPTGSRRGTRDPSLILIVDDDPDYRLACRWLLERQGYRVLEAADGRMALHILTSARTVHPALILLDLSMPIMDGRQFLTVLRSYARLQAIPVILISANHPDLDLALHGAIAGHLRKPYDPAELLRLLAESTAPRQ